MTSMGFAILDYFTQSLDTKYARGKWLVTSRGLLILKRMYSWEDAAFATEKEVAIALKLSSERIRQLKYKTLRKVGIAAKQGKNPAQKIITILESYARGKDPVNIYRVIVNLCVNEMPELPAIPLIKLLAGLYFTKSTDIQATCDYYTLWKKTLEKKHRQLEQENRKLEYENKLRAELLKNIIWFDHIKKRNKEDFIGKEPKRKVNHNNNYNSGTFFSHKCNRSIQYESGVELKFIQKLEMTPSVIYYLEQPVTITYTRQRTNHWYTPDFAVLLEDGHCFITEVKHSYDDMLDARVHRRMEALIAFCEKHGMGLLLTNGKYSLNYLINYPCSYELEQVLQTKLNERGGRTIFLKEFKEVLAQCQAKRIDFLALVLKNNWGYYPYPFKLAPKSYYSAFREKIIDKLQ